MLKKIDYTILFTVIIIIAYSLIVIYSATKPAELLSMVDSPVVNQAPLGVFKKQVLNIMLGFVAMAVLLYLHYENLSKHVKFLYVLNLLMLASVLFMGHSALGATRWIEIGPFRFQPSEFAKLIIIICFAAFLVPRVGKLNRMRDLVPCFAFIALPLGLIVKQPDLGTSLVFLAIMFGMLFAAGARPLLLISLITGGLGAASLWIWGHFWLLANRGFNLWIPLKDYQLERLLIFIDPWKDPLGDGYHVIQSQIAIGQGGLFGRGLFQGSQTHGNFLPIQETDFIFSVVGEEFGLNQNLAQYVDILKHTACTIGDSQQGFFRKMNRHTGLLTDQMVQPAQERTASGHNNTPVHDIRRKFRRRLLQSSLNGFNDTGNRLRKSFIDFFRSYFNGLGKSRNQVTAPHLIQLH
jgi:rod shape determining protein RodA